jgi:hypothetical protein
MRPALIIALGVVFAALYLRDAPAPQKPATGELENELSLVQIEKMRVISPDSETAARLSEQEEKLKYELLGGGTLRESSVRQRRSSDGPERAASVPLCPFAASAKRTPRS